MSSLYRRPLPELHVPFSSAAGRALFREALAEGTLEGFFPLIEQFHTQADPAFCGLGSLVMALNALEIDPGRLWRGPWRWFSEELLDCCTPLSTVRKAGISLEELACLSRCNGAKAELFRADRTSSEELALAVEHAARSPRDAVVVASYSRAGLGQTGSGHFSPIGGYHPQRRLVLILDVARFKYPPHWVPLAELHAAMLDADPVTGLSRGWVSLRRGGQPSNLAHFFSCAEGASVALAAQRLLEHTQKALRARTPVSLSELLSEVGAAALGAGLSECVRVRKPETPEHDAVFEALRCALVQSPLHGAVSAAHGEAFSELITTWVLAAPERLWAELPRDVRSRLLELTRVSELPSVLAKEVEHLRAQLDVLLAHVHELAVDRELAAPSAASVTA
ncbi:MAG TPA: phytochelatin synthase family protein [Polyangiaceae bacterium]|nr:phytochelatin synthase family protein [Polyangiaceae bacterium]